jgi:hypothetical protein
MILIGSARTLKVKGVTLKLKLTYITEKSRGREIRHGWIRASDHIIMAPSVSACLCSFWNVTALVLPSTYTY